MPHRLSLQNRSLLVFGPSLFSQGGEVLAKSGKSALKGDSSAEKVAIVCFNC